MHSWRTRPRREISFILMEFMNEGVNESPVVSSDGSECGLVQNVEGKPFLLICCGINDIVNGFQKFNLFF